MSSSSASKPSPAFDFEVEADMQKLQRERAALVGEEAEHAETGKWVWRRPAARLWVHIFLHLKEPDFDLVPMLIGRGGQNMKEINKATGAKLRIRGKGSGHMEVGNKEAPVPLMLAVTTNKGDRAKFKMAVDMTVAKLVLICQHYKIFCYRKGLVVPPSQNSLFSFGEISRGSEDLLREHIQNFPHPGGPRPIKKMTPGGIDPNGADDSDDIRYDEDTLEYMTAMEESISAFLLSGHDDE